jgi:hypothetical protein
VLCGLNKEFNRLPEECPAIPIDQDPENIYRELKFLMGKPERIHNLADQGRKYVEKYHDSLTVAKQIIHWIEGRPAEELIQPRR